MKIEKRHMEIEYDFDCLPDDLKYKMEDKLIEFLHEYGWTNWASGADVCAGVGMGGEYGVRIRDLGFFHCPDTECEHWDGRSGCDAEYGKCVKDR